MPVPNQPKIYHIVHMDRLPHIIAVGHLYSDAHMQAQQGMGTTIGMSSIKARRLTLGLSSHPGLHVGDCVPFYFCPRSVMLYVISCQNHPELAYHDGQEPIIHREVDLHTVLKRARKEKKRWAFTTSNAGARYFEDYCTIDALDNIDWEAVEARDWRTCKEEKQAEFLVERSFPWDLVEHIGVKSKIVQQQVNEMLLQAVHRPPVDVQTRWYY